ncbi:MAG TPA: hypothetical protein EYP69_01060 [Bacteroidales bacterium]|nr:hypothetical protein [Bacteroidales bacterium]
MVSQLTKSNIGIRKYDYCYKKMSNNAIQGTSGQRGFPKFSLVVILTGLSKLVAANPACP